MKNSFVDLDKTDIKILKILQKEGRLSVVRLAKRVNLTTTPCAERLKRLERKGVIKDYQANINPDKVSLQISIFIQIRLDQTSMSVFDRFTEAVKDIPEIEESYLLTGSFDAMIKVRVADMSDYRQFMSTELRRLPGIIHSQSQVVTEKLKHSYGPNPELITRLRANSST